MADLDYLQRTASATSPFTHQSGLVEKTLEYRFLADLTSAVLRRRASFEILRSDIDNGGYDLVIEVKGVLRHVQLKGRAVGGKRSEIALHIALEQRSSACVIVMLYDPITLAIEEFRWLGSAPGLPIPALGDRAVKHSKGNATGQKLNRPLHRSIPLSRFERVVGIEALIERMFGLRDARSLLISHLCAQSQEAGDIAGPHEARQGQFEAISEPLDWDDSLELAMMVDGYSLLHLRSTEEAGLYLERQERVAHRTGRWPGDAVDLWATLFLQHRRFRFADTYPPPMSLSWLLNHLVLQLREALVAIDWPAGPEVANGATAPASELA